MVLALAVDKALPSVTVIPVPLIVMALERETPLVVIVLVVFSVHVPVLLQVVVDDRVTLPAMVIVPEPVNVHVAPVVVMLLQFNVPDKVIVGLPLALSTITSSADVGAAAPAPPPLLVDQCVVVVFHVPLPPTQ